LAVLVSSPTVESILLAGYSAGVEIASRNLYDLWNTDYSGGNARNAGLVDTELAVRIPPPAGGLTFISDRANVKSSYGERFDFIAAFLAA
jgi:hypothetical protein